MLSSLCSSETLGWSLKMHTMTRQISCWATCELCADHLKLPCRACRTADEEVVSHECILYNVDGTLYFHTVHHTLQLEPELFMKNYQSKSSSFDSGLLLWEKVKCSDLFISFVKTFLLSDTSSFLCVLLPTTVSSMGLRPPCLRRYCKRKKKKRDFPDNATEHSGREKAKDYS